MKLNKKFKFAVIAAAVATLSGGVTSCNYLDVVPPEQPGLSDAMKTHDNALGFLYSCYNKMTYRDFMTRDYRSTLNASTDEYLITETWYANEGAPAYAILRNTQTTTPPAGYSVQFWDELYAGIGQTLLFDKRLTTEGLENDVNSGNMEEYNQWLAESRFCRAFYHFQLLRIFGPIPLTTELIDMDCSLSDYPGRTHFDGCVDWIANELDEACKYLPDVQDSQNTGRATKTICKALKARLLLYAASDLWNGKFPSAYRGWCQGGNTNYESENPVTGEKYGRALVYVGEPRVDRWVRALFACQEALDYATKVGGFKLFDKVYYTNDDLIDDEVTPEKIYIPKLAELTAAMNAANITLPNTNINGYDPETSDADREPFSEDEFRRAVWKLRYLNSTTAREGNTEIIWSHINQVYGWKEARIPRNAYTFQKDGNSVTKEGWNGLAPTLYTVEHFLNADGTLPGASVDKTAFPILPSSNFYDQPSPVVPDDENGVSRKSITQICLNREPRFYAWIAFDGGDYLTGMRNGDAVHLDMKDPYKQGYGNQERNYSASGFLSMKHIDPLLHWDNNGSEVSGKNSPEVFIRLAELYLNLAECQAELSENFKLETVQGYTLPEGCTTLQEAAIKNINKIRARAYVAPLEPAMLGMTEVLSSNGEAKKWDIVQWVRNERFIELWDEGQRYFDVRRWVAGDEYFGYGKRRTLNALVEQPTLKQFNQPMVANSQYTFHYREYLYPIYVDEVYKNPQMVQNPGF